MEAHLGSLSLTQFTQISRGGRLPPSRVRLKFASNTALAHPRGVADRMFLVRCDFPPSSAACGA